MNINQRKFIKGYHVNLSMSESKIKRVMVGNKEFYWEVPQHLEKKLKKGDLVLVNVENKHTGSGNVLEEPVRRSMVLVDDILDNFQVVEGMKLKWVYRIYTGKKAELIQSYIESGLVNRNIEKSLGFSLAKKCNLSEKSMNSLLKKYDEEKVKRAVDIFLATDDRKAPLKFIKFVLEKI